MRARASATQQECSKSGAIQPAAGLNAAAARKIKIGGLRARMPAAMKAGDISRHVKGTMLPGRKEETVIVVREEILPLQSQDVTGADLAAAMKAGPTASQTEPDLRAEASPTAQIEGGRDSFSLKEAKKMEAASGPPPQAACFIAP